MGKVLLMNPPPKTNFKTTKGEIYMARKGRHLYAKSPIPARHRTAGFMTLHNYGGYPMSYRPYGGHSLLRNPVLAIKENLVHPIKMDSLKAFGSAAIGAILVGQPYPGRWLFGKIPVLKSLPVLPTLLGNALNMTIVATGTNLATNSSEQAGKISEQARNALAGGLGITGVQIVLELYNAIVKSMESKIDKTKPEEVKKLEAWKKVPSMITMSGLGLGDDLEDLRAKIEEQVKQELMQGLGERSLPYETVGERALPYETVGERALPYETVGQVELNKIEAGGISSDTM